MQKFQAVVVISAAVAVLGVCQQAASQQYPAKSIRLIALDGGNDTIARLIGQKIAPALGQQIVVDNRAGAGGLIAAELGAKSPDIQDCLLKEAVIREATIVLD